MRIKYIVNQYESKCVQCGAFLLKNKHIHHKIPISKGGDHSFDNLELLCEQCHLEKHPFMKIMTERKGFNYVKSTSKQWICYECGGIIASKESYYGDRHKKLCMSCAPLKWKKDH
jgi:hypothetical protein